MEAERSILQGEPVDDPGQIQSLLPIQRDEDEARAVRGDAEVGEGAGDPAGRARDRGGYGLSEQLPVWLAAIGDAVVADADAPTGLAAEQEEARLCHEVWVRGGQPRGQYDAEVHVDPGAKGGGRRHRGAR